MASAEKSTPMSNASDILSAYLQGPKLLREAIDGMKLVDLQARPASGNHPVTGKWSTHEVICHLADFEIINAERIMRMLSEDSPQLLNADPDPMAANLNYQGRDTLQQLLLIESIRQHVAAVLQGANDQAWQRTGKHSTDGILTVENVLQRVASHVPHHIPFIQAKRAALTAS
jgi:hypothetical protein